MPRCPACGADTISAQLEDGTRLQLDNQTEPTGDRRYSIVDFGNAGQGVPHTVKPVAKGSNVSAYPDHMKDCPAGDNGLR